MNVDQLQGEERGPLQGENRLSGQGLEDLARAQAYEMELERYSKEEVIEIAVTERVRRMQDMRHFLSILAEHDIAVFDLPPCEWGSGERESDVEVLDLDELEMELGHPPSEEELEQYLSRALLPDEELDYDDIVAIAKEINW